MLGNNIFYQNMKLENDNIQLCLNNFPYNYFGKITKQGQDTSVIMLNFNDWNSILESQSICYLNLIQVFFSDENKLD